MHSSKQEVLDSIQSLPDSADIEDIMYQLYALGNVRRGQQDAYKGNTESTADILKEIQTW